MERTIAQTTERGKDHIQIQKCYIGLFAVGLGSMANPLAYGFAFLTIAYFYMRDRKECNISIAGILFGSLLCGFVTTYFYALGCTIFFLIIHVLQLLQKNVYQKIPVICALLTIPYGLLTYGVDLRVGLMAFLVLVLARLDHRQLTWIQTKLVLTSTMYGVFFVTVIIQLQPWLPAYQATWIITGLFFLMAFFIEPLPLICMLLLCHFCAPNVPLSLFTIAATMMIVFGKKTPWMFSGGSLLLGFWLQIDFTNALLLGIGSISSFLYEEKKLPFHIERHKEQEDLVETQSMLNKQIHNFSSIFASLSEYYEQVSDVEAQMLADMAKALKYSADTLKRVDTKQTQKQRILNALEGYQYEVASLELEDHGDGNLAIELDIQNIKRSEINTTLLPLLEVLTQERLKVTSIRHHRFTNGYYHIILENHVPFQIDAYADSQKNMFEASGDSFSIFRYRNTVISMISDGMGSGEHAAASSRLITNIFQRMVVSGIPKADSIKCINKLLQSDAYATLDVVCFDCSSGKAYIFKSAACPTFLIRDGELYEINGSSLPVGIISTIEPDCFVVDLKEGDEYLIVSDGIYMDEIYEWLKTRKEGKAKASIEHLMSILHKHRRMDDSTAVLSRVNRV